MATSSYSDRDLSLVPQQNVGDIDKYASSKSLSSGKKHISKECQYFVEGYIHSVRVKKYLLLTCVLQPDTSLLRPPSDIGLYPD